MPYYSVLCAIPGIRMPYHPSLRASSAGLPHGTFYGDFHQKILPSTLEDTPYTTIVKRMMIRTLAIDDEPLALQQLAVYIKKIPFLELVGECQSAIDAHMLMQEEAVDAIFCDINMPDLNGLDFVRSLDPRPQVVFTTAYSQYAVEGYKVDAGDYLLKPFSFEEFRQSAERIKRQYELIHHEEVAVVTASGIDENDDIFLKTEYKVMRVKVSDIRCVEGMSEYLKIHLVSRERPVVVLMSMKKLEERLPHSSFMRVHRSWMVNLRRIQEINKSRITLDNDQEVPVGDLYRDAFQKYIESKFVGK